MSQITVWGRASSANVQKVLWALDEVKQPYERIDAGGRFGGLDTPEYGGMNPNRLVPVLRDGELTLWESSAIVRYVAARYGAGSLWPEDPAERAHADQWADWVSTTFQPAWIGVFLQVVRVAPSKRDRQAVATAVNNAAQKFAMLDSRLANVPYVGGDSFTFADILAGTALYRWETMDIDRPKLANVDAWHERLKQHDGFNTHVCSSYDELMVRD